MRNYSQTPSLCRIASSQRNSAVPPRLPRHRRALRAALLAAFSLAPTLAHAQTDYWNVGTGYWDVASNWTLGLPTSSYDVENDTAGTITFRKNTVTVNSFLNTSTGGFNLTGGTLTTNTFFENSGSGTFKLSGGTLNVGTDYINSGSGAVNVSGSTINVTGNFLNSGSGALSVSKGALNISGDFTDNSTNVTVSGGTLDVLGNTSLGSNTLDVTGGTVSLNTLTLDNGALTGSGTISLSGSGYFYDSNTIQGVTLSGTGTLTQTGGVLTLDGSKVSTSLELDNGATLDLYHKPTLSMSSIVFGHTNGYAAGSLELEGNGGSASPYTIGSGTTISANLGYIGDTYYYDGNSSQLTNAGTILLNTAGLTTEFYNGYLTKFTNSGTLQASNGNNVIFDVPTTNTGMLSIASGSTATLNDGLVQSGGATLADGALNIPSGESLQLKGGSLEGNGTITGNVSNTGEPSSQAMRRGRWPSAETTCNRRLASWRSNWVGHSRASATIC